MYCMRVNLSVAIVAMVRPSTGENNTGDIGTECPAGSLTNDTGTGTFDWSSSEQGVILGSFFYGYVASQIPGGYFAEQFGGKWPFGIGSVIMTLATLLTPWGASSAYGKEAMIALRTFVGLGGGLVFPATHMLIANWIPNRERTKSASLIWAGQ